MRKCIPIVVSVLVGLAALKTQAGGKAGLPDPGPENGGLRLRLLIRENSEKGKEGYDVTLELLNVTKQAITLRADWRYENDKGNLKDYLEAAVNIETDPPIAPWVGQVRAPNRKSPQPEYELKSGEVLSLNWLTSGRHLKNSVTDPNTVQNPEFPTPGLYSVHATVIVRTIDPTVLLRSNDQPVSVGGSQEIPKYTYGTLWYVNADSKTARLSLGSLHKIKTGDHFKIRTGMRDFWKLTITQVELLSSEGSLEFMQQMGSTQPNPNPRFPERYMNATLISQK